MAPPFVRASTSSELQALFYGEQNDGSYDGRWKVRRQIHLASLWDFLYEQASRAKRINRCVPIKAICAAVWANVRWSLGHSKADQISRDVRLSDGAVAAIVSCYGVRHATELILCCSSFNMPSHFLEATRVELEVDLEGLHANA